MGDVHHEICFEFDIAHRRRVRSPARESNWLGSVSCGVLNHDGRGIGGRATCPRSVTGERGSADVRARLADRLFKIWKQ